MVYILDSVRVNPRKKFLPYREGREEAGISETKNKANSGHPQHPSPSIYLVWEMREGLETELNHQWPMIPSVIST